MLQANVGAPRWLTFIVCLWGLCAALMACMRTGAEFVLLRLALGVFEAGTFPGIWFAPAFSLLSLISQHTSAAPLGISLMALRADILLL